MTKSTKSNQQTVKNLQAKLARAMADYANLEKRYARNSDQVVKFATVNLITKLLDLRDHLQLTVSALNNQGVNLILSELDKIIADEGVITIDTKSKQFDPNYMECAEMVVGPKDKVIDILKVGYKLHDRVLRHARVTVGNGESTSSNNK